MKIAIEHFNAFLKYGPSKEISNVTFYEFGAGWDLIIPLAYYAFGVEHQTLIDIRPNIRFELVNDTLIKFSTGNPELEKMANRPLNIRGPVELRTVEDLKTRFGITYLAPVDASDTKLPS